MEIFHQVPMKLSSHYSLHNYKERYIIEFCDSATLKSIQTKTIMSVATIFELNHLVQKKLSKGLVFNILNHLLVFSVASV